MKKLTLATMISSMFTLGAIAGEGDDPIHSTFASLDNNQNGYISVEEADDDDIIEYFTMMDTNEDNRVSHAEYDNYLAEKPEHFTDDLKGEDVDVETDVLVTQTEQVETSRDLTDTRAEVETEIESEFMQMDADMDGEIARNEASEQEVLENFDEIDENGDHVITRMEYRSYLTDEYDSQY